jgi:hypothetical protein
VFIPGDPNLSRALRFWRFVPLREPELVEMQVVQALMLMTGVIGPPSPGN